MARNGGYHGVAATGQLETKKSHANEPHTDNGISNHDTHSIHNYGSVGAAPNHTQQEKEPAKVEANACFVSIVYVFLGIGVWLPWNAFTAAKHYFQTRLCGVFDNVELWFVLALNLSHTAVTLVLLFGGTGDEKKPQDKQAQGASPPSSSSSSSTSSSSLQDEEENHNANKTRAKGDPHGTAGGFTNGYHGSDGRGDGDSPVYDYSDGDVGNENTTSPHCNGTMTRSATATTTTTATRPTEQDVIDDDEDVLGYRMVMAPFSNFLVVFVVTTLFVLITKVSSFTLLTISSLVVSGVSTAIALVGIMTSATVYPRGIGMNSFSSGEAVGGVFVSTVNFIAAWVLPPQEASPEETVEGDDPNSCVPYRVDWGAFVYFLSACLAFTACLVAFHTLHRSPVRQFYRRLNWQRHEQREDDEEEALLLVKNEDHSPATVARVWRKVALLVVAITGTPLATLPVAPAWTSQMQSHNEAWNFLFVPLTFVLFNVGDLAGRLLSTLLASSITSRQLVVACVLRMVVFWPAFMFGVRTSTTTAEGWFGGDTFAILLQLAFGVTNGLMFSLVFGHFPTLVSRRDEQEIASSLITLGLGFGSMLGSFGSFAYVEVARRLGV